MKKTTKIAAVASIALFAAVAMSCGSTAKAAEAEAPAVEETVEAPAEAPAAN